MFSFAQSDSSLNERLQKSSIEFERFNKQFRSGSVMQMIGGLTIVAGSIQNVKPLIIAGGVFTIFGFIINSVSSDHIRKAGIILRGNSIILPIGKK